MRFEFFGIAKRFAALAALAAIAASPALPVKAQSETPKKIGIIGAGNIGSTFGTFWIKAGYDVLFASRHPEALKPLVEKLGPKAHVGKPAEALTYADTVFLAVPYKAYPEFGTEYAAALKGKVVIDAGNATAARDGELRAEVDQNGIGVTSQRYLPGARIVRAFNAANFKVFEKNAGRPEPRMAIPIAGDDPKAIETARVLVTYAGFDPVLVGGLEAAKQFQMGQPGFGLELSAPELKETLGVAP
ncbi:NADPH-dependent F420 reductase [Methylobacterium haplocladii]|uniref:NADP oxidoreductase n=1 Tax=Methylobacterium haplocladii TaxID=1176176 RepID=A0A512IUE1_9HYPH|nr:NAD(P)-binding domain-containing protein [Methylobacterium haplocladii]GEP01323.1 NADP oxidoreductase [Methylobacterium haplocladii]GJD83867.1 Pyrroline-5-carboxylate reductase [Methylobacterium haplocladii]GLS59974.1 NADP oxidoreductase [Methylobacterium haplocladii]